VFMAWSVNMRKLAPVAAVQKLIKPGSHLIPSMQAIETLHRCADERRQAHRRLPAAPIGRLISNRSHPSHD
jgi:hypothetical protein